MTLKTFGEFDNAKGVNYQSAFVQFVKFVFEKEQTHGKATDISLEHESHELNE